MKIKIDPNFLIDAAETLSDPKYSHIFSGKTTFNDYKIKGKLAKGGYGELYMVESKSKLYAMKKILKTNAKKHKKSNHVMNEKTIMTSIKSPWLVSATHCFQDKTSLYYIMDYIPGGDLLGYLAKKEYISEDQIAYYGAELFLAVNELHKNGWIHRDLKPENILINLDGHIKLVDFGCSERLTNGKVKADSVVGTADYISPEILQAMEGTSVYGPETDLWTIGVIMYEMHYGTSPFYSDSLQETYARICSIDVDYSSRDISEDLHDLLRNLICKKEKRYTFDDIKKHKFFKNINWKNPKEMTPPYIPHIKNDEDTSNFVETDFTPDNSNVECGFSDFVGFTYDPEYVRKFELEEKTAEDSILVDEIKELQIGLDEIDLKQTQSYIEDMVLSITMEKLNELKKELKVLNNEKKISEKNLTRSRDELQDLEVIIGNKRKELNKLNDAVNSSRKELESLKNKVLETVKIDSSNIQSIYDTSEIKKIVHEAKIKLKKEDLQETLEKIKKIGYWFYNTNKKLEQTAISLSGNRDIENKSLDDIKLELRLRRTEIRDYQQKLAQETMLRESLEQELKILEKKDTMSRKNRENISFVLLNLETNQKILFDIKDKNLTVNGKFGKRQMIEFSNTGCKIINGKLTHPVERLYIRDLRQNELHHMKNRDLAVSVCFLRESGRKSTFSIGRRSYNALETDYNRELNIVKSLQNLLPVLTGKTLEDTIGQIEGSEKKLKELEHEMKECKKNTLVDYEIEDIMEQVYEFNGHVFYEKTMARGSLCDNCDEILYGRTKQGLVCRNCDIVVHRSCYVLLDISCDISYSIRGSPVIYVLCCDFSEKKKLLALSIS